jgi:hypothetical protein
MPVAGCTSLFGIGLRCQWFEPGTAQPTCCSGGQTADRGGAIRGESLLHYAAAVAAAAAAAGIRGYDVHAEGLASRQLAGQAVRTTSISLGEHLC